MAYAAKIRLGAKLGLAYGSTPTGGFAPSQTSRFFWEGDAGTQTYFQIPEQTFSGDFGPKSLNVYQSSFGVDTALLGGSTTNTALVLRVKSDGRLEIFYRNSGVLIGPFSTTGSLPLNTLNEVTFRYGSNQIHLAINGTEESFTATAPNNVTIDFVGRRDSGANISAIIANVDLGAGSPLYPLDDPYTPAQTIRDARGGPSGQGFNFASSDVPLYTLDSSLGTVGAWEGLENASNSQIDIDTANAFEDYDVVSGFDSSVYRCEVTISNYSSGSVKINTATTDSPQLSANGTYSILSTDPSFASVQTGGSGFTGSVRFSVKKYLEIAS